MAMITNTRIIAPALTKPMAKYLGIVVPAGKIRLSIKPTPTIPRKTRMGKNIGICIGVLL